MFLLKTHNKNTKIVDLYSTHMLFNLLAKISGQILEIFFILIYNTKNHHKLIGKRFGICFETVNNNFHVFRQVPKAQGKQIKTTKMNYLYIKNSKNNKNIKNCNDFAEKMQDFFLKYHICSLTAITYCDII